MRNEVFRRFDRRLLLSQFGHGMDDISIEYPVVYENGVRHWREGFLSMVKNPNTGDVEAVTYSYDIDARKRDEFIMNRLIHDHFDYIGIIHPSGKTFEFGAENRGSLSDRRALSMRNAADTSAASLPGKTNAMHSTRQQTLIQSCGT